MRENFPKSFFRILNELARLGKLSPARPPTLSCVEFFSGVGVIYRNFLLHGEAAEGYDLSCVYPHAVHASRFSKPRFFRVSRLFIRVI